MKKLLDYINAGWLYLAVVLDMYRSGCELGHAAPYAEQFGDGYAQVGLVQTTTKAGTNL